MMNWLETKTNLEILDYISDEIGDPKREVFLTLKDDSEEAYDWMEWKEFNKFDYPHCWVYFQVTPKNIERIKAFFKELIMEEWGEYKGSKSYQEYLIRKENMEKK